MSERRVWDITRSPEGPLYRLLIERLGRSSASQFGFAVEHDGVTNDVIAQTIDLLRPFLISRAMTTHWVGTEAMDAHEVLRFRADSAAVGLLAELADGLFDWDGSRLPMDLHFLRDDGSPVLGVTASEEWAWLEVNDVELTGIGVGLRRSLGLQPPESLPRTHEHPAWGSRVDTTVLAPVAGMERAFEELPCERGEDGSYVVCCLPFQVEGVHLGDVVAAVVDRSGRPIVESVSTRAGRVTVGLEVSLMRTSPAAIVERLDAMNRVYEWPGGSSIVVDAMDNADADELISLLLPDGPSPALLACWVQ